MVELLLCAAVLAMAWAMTMTLAKLQSRVALRLFAPNWSKALGSLPVPKDVGKRSRWKYSYFRDRPGAKSHIQCLVSYTEQGILVQELMDHLYHLCWLTSFPNKHTMFIPWTACSRRPLSEGWFARHFQTSLVDLDVAGQDFIIQVDPRMIPDTSSLEIEL